MANTRKVEVELPVWVCEYLLRSYGEDLPKVAASAAVSYCLSNGAKPPLSWLLEVEKDEG